MSITLKHISDHMVMHERRGEYSAADACRRLIIHGLSPQLKAALKLTKNKWVSTPDICAALGVKANHGHGLMESLHKLRLVGKSRRRHTCEWIMSKDYTDAGE